MMRAIARGAYRGIALLGVGIGLHAPASAGSARFESQVNVVTATREVIGTKCSIDAHLSFEPRQSGALLATCGRVVTAPHAYDPVDVGSAQIISILAIGGELFEGCELLAFEHQPTRVFAVLECTTDNVPPISPKR